MTHFREGRGQRAEDRRLVGERARGLAHDTEGRPARPIFAPATPLRCAFWLFVVLALLTLPLFAHGCHGDDVDHEPLFIPLRLNGDE